MMLWPHEIDWSGGTERAQCQCRALAPVEHDAIDSRFRGTLLGRTVRMEQKF
jgi:hypothetical protein